MINSDDFGCGDGGPYGWSFFDGNDGYGTGVSDGFLTNPGNGIGYVVCCTNTGSGDGHGFGHKSCGRSNGNGAQKNNSDNSIVYYE